MKWIALFAMLLAAPPATPAPAVYTRLLFGACTDRSFEVPVGINEDMAQPKRPFRCDQAIVAFLDRQNRRIRIKFQATSGAGEVSSLTFTGVRQRDGQTINVTAFAFGDEAALAANGYCHLFLDGANLTAILCSTSYSRNATHSAVAAFAASPGQSLGLDDEGP